MDNNKSENKVLMYTAADGATKIRVNVDPKENTAWLTQKQMAELFQTTQQNISLHINNILDEGELDKNSVHKFSLYTAVIVKIQLVRISY